MRNKIHLLTPLRGVGALFVAIFHARLIFFPQWKDSVSTYTQLLENSFLWVDLFFILSGFVMMHVYKETFTDGATWNKWKHFMWLRFSRIYPAFALTLFILVLWELIKASNNIGFYGGPLLDSWGMTGIAAFEGPFNTASSLWSNVLLIHAVSENSLTWNIASWSLSVEWLSYIIFPFLIPLLSKRSSYTVWLPLLGLLTIFYIVRSHGTLDVTYGLSAFMRALSSFIIGGWLCNVIVPKKIKCWLNNDIALLSIIFITAWLLHSNVENSFIVITFSLLVFICSQQSERNSIPFKILENRISQFFGDISYSIYLWHVVILLPGIEVMNIIFPEFTSSWFNEVSWTSGLIGLTIYLAFTTVISSISYYYIEKPLMRKMRKSVLSVNVALQ